MDISDLMNFDIKRPIQKGSKVYVYDINDKLIEVHETSKLTKDFKSMTNDCFYDFYGFNFIPK